MHRSAQRIGALAWPAFLAAAVLEVAVFAFADPLLLRGIGGAPLDLSATAVYTLSFAVFWVVAAAACGLTRLLDRAADEINAGRS